MDGYTQIRLFCETAGAPWRAWQHPSNGSYRLLYGERGKVLYCYDTNDGITLFVDAGTREDEAELRRLGRVIRTDWDAGAAAKRGMRIAVTDLEAILQWCQLRVPGRPLVPLRGRKQTPRSAK